MKTPKLCVELRARPSLRPLAGPPWPPFAFPPFPPPLAPLSPPPRRPLATPSNHTPFPFLFSPSIPHFFLFLHFYVVCNRQSSIISRGWKGGRGGGRETSSERASASERRRRRRRQPRRATGEVLLQNQKRPSALDHRPKHTHTHSLIHSVLARAPTHTHTHLLRPQPQSTFQKPQTCSLPRARSPATPRLSQPQRAQYPSQRP
jgi:hypothetical protein